MGSGGRIPPERLSRSPTGALRRPALEIVPGSILVFLNKVLGTVCCFISTMSQYNDFLSARHTYEDNQMLQPSPVIKTKEVIYLGSLQNKEGTSPSSQGYAACPNHTSVGAPGGHERGLYSTNDKVNPLANSTSKQLSIIDILGDDGPNCELESSTHEGHVAFSIKAKNHPLQWWVT